MPAEPQAQTTKESPLYPMREPTEEVRKRTLKTDALPAEAQDASEDKYAPDGPAAAVAQAAKDAIYSLVESDPNKWSVWELRRWVSGQLLAMDAEKPASAAEAKPVAEPKPKK